MENSEQAGYDINKECKRRHVFLLGHKLVGWTPDDNDVR